MTPFRPVVLVLVVLIILAAAHMAFALHGGAGGAQYCSNCYRWHGNYYSSAWGRPVALVVPPTADYATHWGWGVGNTRITPICAQFQPNCPGVEGYNGQGLRPTLPWPSHTDQFGVYYVRGPW